MADGDMVDANNAISRTKRGFSPRSLGVNGLDHEYLLLAVFGGVREFHFGPVSDTPELSGSAYVRLSTQLGNSNGELAFRAEVYAQDGWWYANTGASTAPLTYIPSYTLVNLRAEWNNMFNSEVDLAFWARNVTNEKYYAGGNSNASTGGFNSVIPGAPRMYGFELAVQF